MEEKEKTTEEIIEGLRGKVSVIKESSTPNNGTNEIVSNIKLLVSRKTLVPVICEDMYEYTDPITKKRQLLHSYIVEKIIERAYNSNIIIELTEEELKNIVNEGYYGISLLQSKLGKDLYKEIFNLIMDEDNNVYDNICVKKEVLSFLLVCNFPLIITTSCFPILEKELEGGYESYWNEYETKNDKDLPSKCIYHIFGESKPNDSNWGYNEKHVLHFLKSSLGSYSLANLTAAKENPRKTLMFLGNDSPDWLFRFILTPIYGGDVYDDGNGYYMSVDCRDEECSLNQFLSDIQFEKESELINVLKNVTAKIENTKPSNPTIKHGKKYDFFVAHAGEDTEDALKLVERLRNNGLEVWFDRERLKDGYYWEKIISALKDSAYFIPFVTEHYMDKNKKYETVKGILSKLSINEESIGMEECVKLESHLDGVQIELLLVNKWRNKDPQKTYSIPIYLKGSEVKGFPIDTKSIRRWSENSIYLPQSLFWGLHMYEFDVENPQRLVLDWGKYKKI